jgi:signal transduction histidine kinase
MSSSRPRTYSVFLVSADAATKYVASRCRAELAKQLGLVISTQLFDAGLSLRAIRMMSDDDEIAARVGAAADALDKAITEIRALAYSSHDSPAELLRSDRN